MVLAHREELSRHTAASVRLRQIAEGGGGLALPVFCLAEFLRVVTHPRVLHPPSSLEIALRFVERLLRSEATALLLPGARFWQVFDAVARAGEATGNLIFDAQIAAVCREHGVSDILTLDRDFARFPGIRIVKLETAPE